MKKLFFSTVTLYILILFSFSLKAQFTIATWNEQGIVNNLATGLGYTATNITVGGSGISGSLPTVNGWPTTDNGAAYLEFMITVPANTNYARASVSISGTNMNFRATYNIGSGETAAGTGSLPSTVEINPLITNYSGTITYKIYLYGSGGSITLSSGQALPIELTSFTGTPVQNTIVLKWASASEKNNAYMAVERSKNGVDFVELQRIKGHGTTNIAHTYTWTDPAPLAGVNYYRLRQVDLDGEYAYHPVIAVEFAGKIADTGIRLYPTEVKDVLTLVLKEPTTQAASLLITDVNGRTMLQRRLGIGSVQESFTVAMLPQGQYWISIQAENSLQTARFVKIR